MNQNQPNTNRPRVLIYGYGNPGRQDDGLGVLLVDRLEQWAATEGLRQVSFDSNYQLNLEDALSVLDADIVVFADASADEKMAFRFREIVAAGSIPFTTHALAPEAVLALCHQLYGRCPRAFLLTLRGFAWEPNEAMTAGAASNLDFALQFLRPLLLHPRELRRASSFTGARRAGSGLPG